MAAGDEFARRLTDEALSRMHYLHAALTETLRLYPSLPWLLALDTYGFRTTRSASLTSDDVLPDGFSVGKGDIVFYGVRALGRMEYLWGGPGADTGGGLGGLKPP